MKLVVLALFFVVVRLSSAANIRRVANVGAEKEVPEAQEHSTKYSPNLGAHEISNEAEAETFFQNLIGKTQKIKVGTNTARKQSREMCIKEIAATKAWIKEPISVFVCTTCYFYTPFD